MLEALQDPATLVRRRARDLAEALGTIAGFVEEPATPAPFNGPLRHARRVVWRSFPFEEFASLRTAAACTINDAALAVIAGALRRHLGEHDVCAEESCIRVVVPMNLRAPGRELDLGNQVTAIFPRLPVHIADPVERLHRMREEMRHLKLRGQAGATSLAIALAGALPSITKASILRAVPDVPVVNSLCTNVTGPKRTLRLAGAKMLEIHAIAPLFLNVGLSFAVASYGGKISICAVGDPALVPDLEAIADGLEESLYETRTALWQRSQALTIAHRLATGPTVEELMSRDFVTIGEHDSLERAEEIMRERRVSHVPVVDHGLRLLGVLTQKDLLFASSTAPVESSHGSEETRSLSRTVAAWVARSKLTVAAPNEAAFDAGRRMVEHELDFLPVVDDTGRLLGLVTGEHILRWTTKRATA
jgi:CBS domain-containing protein